MTEKILKPLNGYVMLLVWAGIIASGIYFLTGYEIYGVGALLLATAFIMLFGFYLVAPNQSKVMVLFGKYVGTVKQNGLFWTNPFYAKRKISLRARNFDSERVKVNDRLGNPIMISVILVWKVKETYKASFEVDNYESFVRVQSDAAVRKLAGLYSYDNFDDEQEEVTLRSGMQEVNEALEKELDERLKIAGIDVLEARIGYLAYASEIAAAMLKRQQAEAIVAARFKIVEGAVSMVEMALQELNQKEVVNLDEEAKATMVSNLMVVLCGDKEATPVLNTGTLNT